MKKDSNNNYIKETNPYLNFKNINNDIVSFYMQFNQLKNIYRQGWLDKRINIENKFNCETIAEHSFSVALLADSIIQKYELNLDRFKCMQLSIVHDIAEVYTGDIISVDVTSKEDKYILEEKSFDKLLSDISFENDYKKLWQEFEDNITNEAKFIKEVDNLEFLMQAAAYGFDVKYFKWNLNKVQDKIIVKIIDELLKITDGNKVPGNK